jgi:hypothetical protein
MIAKESLQVCNGRPFLGTIYFDTVDWATSMPSLSNSPWILERSPERGFSKLILRIRCQICLSTTVGHRADATSVAISAIHSVPAHDRLRPDDGYGVRMRESGDKAKRTEPGPPNAIHGVGALPKNVELMPQYQDFGLQPPSRQTVAQYADKQEAGAITRRP